MAIYTPGASKVIINEIDLSQIVTGASASVAGQVIVSNQGDPNPMLWTNGQDYMAEYGNPNAQISFDVYCGLDYFSEGNRLWALRVLGEDYSYAGALMYNTAAGSTELVGTTAVTDPEFPAWATLQPDPTDVPIAYFYPRRGPGSYAHNIAVSISSPNLTTPDEVDAESQTTGGTMPAGTYQYQVAALSADGATLATAPVTVVIAGGGVTNQVTVSWSLVPNAIGYRVYGRVAGATYGAIQDVGQGATQYIDTGAVTPNVDLQPVVTPTVNPEFVVNVFNTDVSITSPVESFTCTLEPSVDGDGVATELAERINPFSQWIRVTSNVPALPTVPTIDSAALTNFTGGDSGTAPTSFDVAAAWSRYQNRELYAVNLLINGGHADPGVQMAMEALARTRGDAVALLDVPSNSQQFQQAINYRNLSLNLNSSYAALFCPDVLENDTINGKQQYVPFSGWSAALCARTDRIANPSYSIAGLNRGLINVLRLRYNYDPGQSDALFNAQVNYTRNFVGQGIALWEQQTMQAKSSALSWLSVRRIVNVIKVSLYNFGLYVLQEPNDEFTRRQLVGSFSDYLETLKNARALNSYTVISDNSNNSAADANSGILKATVILVPVIPVHQLVIDLVISKQGVSFTETLQSLGISG